MIVNLVASLFALAGTSAQMTQQLGKLSATDPEGFAAFEVIEGWKDEHPPVRHPVRWARTRMLVRGLLKASPTEAADYHRASKAVLAWGCLCVAALLFSGGALLELLGIKL